MFISVLIDIMLLTVITSVGPLEREYFYGELYPIDEFLHAFKLLRLICVLYVAFDVKGIQLSSISLSFIVLFITISIFLFGPTQNQYFFALIITTAR